MDLFNAFSDLVETTKQLVLWNEDSADLQKYECLNSIIQSGDEDAANKFLEEFLSDDTTSDYDILNKALDYGYIDIANFMLDQDCKVNKISFIPAFTPLHNAVKLGSVQLVEKLLEKEAAISYVNSNRDTPLHLAFNDATFSDDYKLVDLLLAHIKESSCYINVRNQYGLSHLHIAVARGNIVVVKKFVEAGVSLYDFINDDSPTHAGYTALEFACDIKSLDLIKICRQVHPDEKKINKLVRNYRDEHSFIDIISQAFKYKDNFYRFVIKVSHMEGLEHVYNILSEFHLSCLEDDLDTVKICLENVDDINEPMSRNAEYTPLYTALHFALESDVQRFEKVKLLIEHDADVYQRNGFCMTALHLAMYIYSGIEECPLQEEKKGDSLIMYLYNLVEDKEANPMDYNGLTYFHIAVVVNDVDLVKHFLKSGEDVNQSVFSGSRSYSNYTPLHFAVKYKREEIVKMLIDHGAEVNHREEEEDTPLQIALKYGYYRIINLLLENNANVDVVDSNVKMTTLHLLVQYYIRKSCDSEDALKEKEELIGFVKEFVNSGVDVNAKDYEGSTVLHQACFDINNGIWLIERLISLGADINLKNKAGETPLDVARFFSYRSTYDDLLLLYHHVQRLKALGLDVDANNEDFCKAIMEEKEEWKNNENWKIVEDMYSEETLNRKREERFNEISKLKEDMITEDVSLYDYLKMDAEQAAGYIENERIKKIINGEAEVWYEVYGYLFAIQYRKSLDWLEEQASYLSEDGDVLTEN